MNDHYTEKFWKSSSPNWSVHGISVLSAYVLRCFSSLLIALYLVAHISIETHSVMLAFIVIFAYIVAVVGLNLLMLRAPLLLLCSLGLLISLSMILVLPSINTFLLSLWSGYQLILISSTPKNTVQKVRSSSLNPNVFYWIKTLFCLLLWVLFSFSERSFFSIIFSNALSSMFTPGLLIQNVLRSLAPLCGLMCACTYYTDQERLRILCEKAYILAFAALVVCECYMGNPLLAAMLMNWMLWTIAWSLWWPRRPKGFLQECLYYDGSCRFCSLSASLIYAEDRATAKMAFSTSKEERITAFHASMNTQTEEKRSETPPEALGLFTDEGRYLFGSDAVFASARRMGGVWKVLALAEVLLPQWLWQRGYFVFASLRHNIPFLRQQCKTCSIDHKLQ